MGSIHKTVSLLSVQSVKEEGVDKTKDLKINLKIFFYF